MKLSFVIPCYRSAKSIGKVVDGIEAILRGIPGDVETKAIRDAQPFTEYEILLVEDCSGDGGATAKEISRLVSEKRNVRGVFLARNAGQHAAALAGFRYASGEQIVLLDDDGQVPLGRIPDLLAGLSAGYDVSCAKYRKKSHANRCRDLFSVLSLRISSFMMDKPAELRISMFLVMRRFVADAVIQYTAPRPYLPGLVWRCTRNIGNVEMEQLPRMEGKSGYRFGKLLRLWADSCMMASLKPLGFLLWAGCLLLGISALAVFCISLLSGKAFGEVPMRFLLLPFLLFWAWLLLSAGILSAYIGRLYLCMSKAPQYVVRKLEGFDPLSATK